jgi:hypothetical protein
MYSKKSFQRVFLLLLLMLALIVVASNCSKHPEADHELANNVLTASDGEPPCGELLENFEQYLSISNTCTADSECDYFEVSPSGCWTLFHKNRRGTLSELQKQLMVPRCRIFLPQFKCAPKPQGLARCRKGRCAWSEE